MILEINGTEFLVVNKNFPVEFYFKILHEVEFKPENLHEAFLDFKIIKISTFPKKKKFKLRKYQTTVLGNKTLLYFKNIGFPIIVVSTEHVQYKGTLHYVGYDFIKWILTLK